ncbi:MAG: hypothetical protein K0R83_1550, partial [Caulobacter sp.]|nr:hypothetical protein [Caulobacter sp.]
FLDIARAEPGRCVVVRADRNLETIEADIRAAVEPRLERVHG